MKKIFTLFLTLVMSVVTLMAQDSLPGRPKRVSKQKSEKIAKARDYDFSDLEMKTIVEEDFSKFTAGSDGEPDFERLDNDELEIDQSYFSTPGWMGLEVYQAGGAAFLGWSDDWYSTGMIITPTIKTRGCLHIKLRARSNNPTGDYINYNLLDSEYGEIVDANYAYIGGEWTEIEFVTTYGTDEGYFYFFSEMYEMYIDDIVISGAGIERPVLNDETNVSDEGFTASWSPVAGADKYQIYAYADKSVGDDGMCVLADHDFANMKQGGSEENPIIDYDNMGTFVNDVCVSDYPGWYIYLPAYADGMVGVTGIYSYMREYGSLSSPVMDMSGNNGEVTIDFSIKTNKDDQVVIQLFSPTDNGYDFVDSRPFNASGEWESHSMTLSGGTELSYIQIIYNGQDVMFIDNVRVSQSLPSGTVYRHHFLDKTQKETSIDIAIPEAYRGSEINYAVQAIKYLNEDLGEIYSDFTELKHVDTPTDIEVIKDNREPLSGVYSIDGRHVKIEDLRKGALYISEGKIMVKK